MLKLAMLSAALVLFASPAFGQETPGAGTVSIERLAHRGTGCRPGTVAQSIASDNRQFTLLFSDYLVDTSSRGGRPARKHCDLDVDVHVPEGWQFTVYGVQV